MLMFQPTTMHWMKLKKCEMRTYALNWNKYIICRMQGPLFFSCLFSSYIQALNVNECLIIFFVALLKLYSF